MVKVTGPLMSMGASGSLGGAITFATNKGRPYVRQKVNPANPKSAKQKGVRGPFKFLTQQWAGIGTTPQGSWAPLADASNISPFNSFCGHNQSRMASDKAPTKAYPAAAAETPMDVDIASATGAVGEIQLSLFEASAGDTPWGVEIFRSGSTGFTPSPGNRIAVIEHLGTSGTYTDTALAAGEYFYKTRSFSNDGVKAAASIEASATAT